MKINRNIKRVATLSVVGAVAVGAIFALNYEPEDNTTAASGTWANYLSTSWMNAADSRYSDYKAEPGSAENSPYLIKTAEEFSGIRAFEGGDALAGKYIMLANDIDLSAHYWDPIELYGYGDPVDDIYNKYYDGIFELPSENLVAHFSGNSMKISGMVINNEYDRVTVRADYGWGGDEQTSIEAGSTGLFSFAYMAKISDVRLESPVINLTETSGISYDGYYGNWETQVSDIAGAVVGVAQYSRVSDVHVNNVKIDYTAEFGGLFEVSCGGNLDVLDSSVQDACFSYYSPMHTIAGGAVGYSFGQTLVRNTSVKGGHVNVKPVVAQDQDEGIYMDGLYNGSVSMGGLIGINHQSALLSTCSSADITFSDDGYALSDAPDDSYPLSIPMFFGGLVGYSSSEYSIQACIYNSCSHSNISIDSAISSITGVGGIVGGLFEDSLVNNFFDGVIAPNSENYTGEIVGMMSLSEDTSIPHMVASNYYLSGKYDAYGTSEYENDFDSMFATITTLEDLVADLNTGRELVLESVLSHSNFSEEYVKGFLTDWSIQDSTFPLSCTDARTAGLNFPDNRIDVPNTGAK